MKPTITEALNNLYGRPDSTCPQEKYEETSMFLATEFRDKLQIAERALADNLPPIPWSPFAEAMSHEGYVRMSYGMRRLGNQT